ncbi:MAG: hypothetical protein IPK82_01160 [Polyangiaceae bacterium]|nr:hypothetical protein [Polyangiaceae bacterium]
MSAPLVESNPSKTSSTHPVDESDARSTLVKTLGLHPLVAFGMFACDWMLFGGEASSAGVGLALTIPIALALTIPSVLIQRFTFRDSWGAALGKGLMVGVLTAVPMPLGSPVTLAGGVIGLFGKGKKKELPPAPPTT